MVVSNWNSQEPFGVIWVYGSVVVASAKPLARVNKVFKFSATSGCLAAFNENTGAHVHT